ncbi:MAG: methyl-accepting chemotaxis protein [Proteobacteria bacterium]|nr:methyl-accepting chemotaxis protein [Pseudomonadota bacterium]
MKSLSLRKKFTIFSSIVVIVSIVVTAFTCLWQVRGDMSRQAGVALDEEVKVFWELLLSKDGGLSNSTSSLEERIKATNISIQDNKLLMGFYGLNDDAQLVDKMGEVFRGSAGIYMNDTLISTNMVNKDGKRITGMKLSAPVCDMVIKNGKPFRGTLDIDGISYFTAYEPLKNKEGLVIGALYIGIPKSHYFAAFNRIVLVICGISVILILLTSLFIYTYTKRTLGPLKYLVKSANKLAEGDLSMEIIVERQDEVGQLLGAMKNMIERWREVVKDVQSASQGFAAKGQELNESAGQMSHRAKDQATRSTQVAASAEETSRTVADVAKNVGSIATYTADTVTVAKGGEEIVRKAVAEVQEIASTVEGLGRLIVSLGDRSKHIGNIIGVIDDIADQTNLLALNAAIEAARAGEQGRGFAVVADEVRKLAERTAKATSEIGETIKAIQEEMTGAVNSMKGVSEKVGTGVTFSAQSGDALTAIVTKANELELMVEQIASATEQMSSTTETIAKDIEEIALISEETSKSSEETNGIANRLLELSMELQKTVSGFRFSSQEIT